MNVETLTGRIQHQDNITTNKQLEVGVKIQARLGIIAPREQSDLGMILYV